MPRGSGERRIGSRLFRRGTWRATWRGTWFATWRGTWRDKNHRNGNEFQRSKGRRAEPEQDGEPCGPAEQFNTAPEAVAPGRQEAAVSDQQPAAAAATAPPTEQTATINAAAPDQQPAAKPKKADESKAARPVAKTTRSAPARRVAKTVRARQTVAKTVAQPTYQYSQPAYTQPTYPQPSYTWADGTAQAPQPIKRVQIKRHGTAKKATPAAQSTPSTATAGLNGTQ